MVTLAGNMEGFILNQAPVVQRVESTVQDIILSQPSK